MKVTIRGLTFDVPVYGSESATRSLAEKVAERFSQAEAESDSVNTQIFALQTALHFAAQYEALMLEDADKLRQLERQGIEDATGRDDVLKSLTSEFARQLTRIGDEIRSLLDEFEGTSPEHPTPVNPGTKPGGAGKAKLRVVPKGGLEDRPGA